MSCNPAIGAKLINRTVEENGLRDLKDLFLAEIIRDGNRICAVTPQHIIQQNSGLRDVFACGMM